MDIGDRIASASWRRETTWRWATIMTAVLALGCAAACSAVDEGRRPVSEVDQAVTGCELDCPGGQIFTCSDPCSVSGGTLDCNGTLTTCPPVCTCTATRYSAARTGRGSGCGTAAVAARSALGSAMQAQCPSGSCNAVESIGECTALGPNRTDGFKVTITETFSCLQC
jgi:hypothetical protein